ncbi:ABC transporter ATP-binding protein [Peterkaempfera bronchialis]|uniref:ABC transporter ATP-binding protein n=1 Tax=Peterkaempfera bronchialis TaxID=2126346 RepID=A0A345T3M7_9ACTN|nr:ABC transporter ATP-binding protein [Peterkaempfera bronchialis]AXI80582.1 ABC transporter ATP-binding protein [Peterkaempfera bronchialis]
MDTLLEVDGLSKHYGGLAAVDDVTFSVTEGETLGIAGPNGAGKTTLFDLISGHVGATAGRVSFAGQEIQRLPIHRICRLGLSRTFQLPSVIDSQTVFANAVAGSHFGTAQKARFRWGYTPEVAERAHEALDFVGLSDKASTPAGPLPVFDKKRLMIGQALAARPRLLMLDEPAGGLTPPEVDSLVELIGAIRARGVTVILIEHVMRALTAVADRVLIMNQGRRLFEGTPAQMMADPEVARVYLGTSAGGDHAQS